MTQDSNDVQSGESNVGLPAPVMSWFSESGPMGEVPTSPPQTCASCGSEEAIQWLLVVTDWVDHICEAHDVPRPEGDCLVPLCGRCRAWVEIIEIAEMAMRDFSESETQRIRHERTRFLESLNLELVRGIRVSEDLSSYSE